MLLTPGVSSTSGISYFINQLSLPRSGHKQTDSKNQSIQEGNYNQKCGAEPDVRLPGTTRRSGKSIYLVKIPLAAMAAGE